MAQTIITIDTSQLEKLAKEFDGFDKEVAEAACHALNRTVDHVFTQIGRIVPKHYAIKKKDVTETLKKKKPNSSNLEASVISTGRRLSFAHFPFTPKTPRRGKRTPTVMVKIKQEKGKVRSRQGFVASTGAKSADKIQYNVFKRLGKSRLPIAPIRTLSVPQMITNAKVAEEIQKSAQAMLEQRMQHEMKRIMTSIDKNIKGK